jgi:hypothetical protein
MVKDLSEAKTRTMKDLSEVPTMKDFLVADALAKETLFSAQTNKEELWKIW